MTPDRKSLLTRWRRALFAVWIVTGIVVALLATVAGPIVSTDGSDGTAVIALASPIAMIIFLATGLAWIILLVLSRRSSPDEREKHHPSTVP